MGRAAALTPQHTHPSSLQTKIFRGLAHAAQMPREGDAVKGRDAPSSPRCHDWKAGGGGSPALRGPAVAHLALASSEDRREKAHGDPLSPLCLADCCGPRTTGSWGEARVRE